MVMIFDVVAKSLQRRKLFFTIHFVMLDQVEEHTAEMDQFLSHFRKRRSLGVSEKTSAEAKDEERS